MNSEIAVIAPDKELFMLLEEIKNEINQPLTIVNAFLNEAVSLAFELQKQGIKVLVSRGGTASKIRDSGISLPIVEIPITEYEVIHLLDQAQKISSKIAVIGFSDTLLKSAEIIGPILGLSVKKFVVRSEEETIRKVKQAKEEGFEVIIGAKLAFQYAQALGMHGVLLFSPKNVVLNSIKEAQKVLKALQDEREWGERLKTILDSIEEGIISVDKNGRITHFNMIADKILNIRDQINKGRPITGLIAESRMAVAMEKGEKWIGEVRDYDGTKYVCNLNPIIINNQNSGAIITFQKLDHLQTLERKVRINLYKKGHVAKYQFNNIISRDPLMDKVIKKAKKYANVCSTILIHGESGTGKEVLAQSIHNVSPRSGRPFVAINCAVLPENILESELFGYVEGAFTGARKGGKMGLFEVAHEGTLFLDEIGEISPAVQASLLRVLEERQIMRIGDDKVIPVDVRIICATNKNLLQLVRDNQFREDLYYRINILEIDLPPLRKRRADIPLLFDFFLEYYANNLETTKPQIGEGVLAILNNYEWPGNIRELKNISERLIINVTDKISCQDLMEVINGISNQNYSHLKDPFNSNSLIRQEELNLILRVIEENNGNKAKAAHQLGISKSTLWRKLKNLRD